MTGLAALAAPQIAAWEGRLELDVFGTDDPTEVASALEGFVREVLVGVAAANFYVSGVGVVAGLRLIDGRDVVVKVHRWNVDLPGLRAMQEVQTHLADRGLPVPRPLAAPAPLGAGLATVEQNLGGRRADGRDPAVRVALAVGLHRLLAATEDLEADLPRALILRPPGAPLWPEPHSARFDLAATAEGAEWIDELGRLARERLEVADPATDRIGHLDWRVQNVAFDDGDEIVAVYDSDSFGKAPEPVVVGNAAGGFCIDWDAGHPDPPPTVEEALAFVADYEAARGSPFSAEERDLLDAAHLAMVAYNARCQHSDLFLQPQIGDTRDIGWFRLLRDRGERLF